MFEGQFISAAGFDYRNFQCSFQNNSVFALEQSFQKTKLFPLDIQEALCRIDSLEAQLSVQNIQIEKQNITIMALNRQIVEKLEIIKVMEDDIFYWKKIIFDAERQEKQIQEQRMPSVIQEQRIDGQEFNDSICQQIGEVLDHVKKIPLDFNDENINIGDFRLTRVNFDPETHLRVQNNMQTKSPQKSKTTSHHRFKTLVKLNIQLMSVVVKIFSKLKNKRDNQDINTLKRSIASFIDDFNSNYQRSRQSGFSVDYQSKTIKFLKQFYSEITQIQKSLFDRKFRKKITNDQKEELKTTAKK